MNIVVLVVGLVIASLATPAISVSSDFKFGFAPANVRVRIHVASNSDNRRLCLQYDGGDTGQYRRSCQDLDGADAPETFWEQLKALPAGDYVFSATVMRNDGGSDVATIEFRVLESVP